MDIAPSGEIVSTSPLRADDAAEDSRDPEDDWPKSPPVDLKLILVEEAERYQQLGNERFQDSQYIIALDMYCRARWMFENSTWYKEIKGADGEFGARARRCLIAVTSNAAICNWKLSDYTACVDACDAVLSLDTSNAKVRYRKGLALRGLGDLDGAETELKHGLDFEPKDAAIKKALADLSRHRKEDLEKEKTLAKKMFA